MTIHIGDIAIAIKLPMLLKVMAYSGTSIIVAIFTSCSMNPYNWGWPDWVKWILVVVIQFFILYRAIKNRNKK